MLVSEERQLHDRRLARTAVNKELAVSYLSVDHFVVLVRH